MQYCFLNSSLTRGGVGPDDLESGLEVSQGLTLKEMDLYAPFLFAQGDGNPKEHGKAP